MNNIRSNSFFINVRWRSGNYWKVHAKERKLKIHAIMLVLNTVAFKLAQVVSLFAQLRSGISFLWTLKSVKAVWYDLTFHFLNINFKIFSESLYQLRCLFSISEFHFSSTDFPELSSIPESFRWKTFPAAKILEDARRALGIKFIAT